MSIYMVIPCLLELRNQPPIWSMKSDNRSLRFSHSRRMSNSSVMGFTPNRAKQMADARMNTRHRALRPTWNCFANHQIKGLFSFRSTQTMPITDPGRDAIAHSYGRQYIGAITLLDGVGATSQLNESKIGGLQSEPMPRSCIAARQNQVLLPLNNLPRSMAQKLAFSAFSVK